MYEYINVQMRVEKRSREKSSPQRRGGLRGREARVARDRHAFRGALQGLLEPSHGGARTLTRLLPLVELGHYCTVHRRQLRALALALDNSLQMQRVAPIGAMSTWKQLLEGERR